MECRVLGPNSVREDILNARASVGLEVVVRRISYGLRGGGGCYFLDSMDVRPE